MSFHHLLHNITSQHNTSHSFLHHSLVTELANKFYDNTMLTICRGAYFYGRRFVSPKECWKLVNVQVLMKKVTTLGYNCNTRGGLIHSLSL